MIYSLNALASRVHSANAKWWHDLYTGEPLQRNVPEILMLIVSEIAEAMEGYRKRLKDDKLLHRNMMDVELVDALIRIFDLAGQRGVDLDAIFEEKMAYNATRIDHTPEHRSAPGGKKF